MRTAKTDPSLMMFTHGFSMPSYYTSLLAPTIDAVKTAARQCGAARCHSHGRCIGSGCGCESGFSAAANCSHAAEPRATVRVKTDDREAMLIKSMNNEESVEC